MGNEYAGKRVLVTGADGFIGSHLVERLVQLGARVRAFCLYTSHDSCGWLDETPIEIRREIEIVRGDVRDSRFVEEACREVEIAFHLAALISIPHSYQAPESFVDTNIRGTLNILEAVRRRKVGRVIVTSTSEVYGTPDELPIRETHPLKPQSPYAASKVAADHMALSFHYSFGVPATILRPFNTFGPRQSPRALLPTILLQLLEGTGEVRLGRLDTRRDLTYISDTVEGFVQAGTVPRVEGEVIHLGTGRAVTGRDLFDAACRALGTSATLRLDAPRLRPEASEVLSLESDPGRARELLGWSPRIGLEEGLRRTADWFRTHRAHFRGNFLV